LKRSEKFANPFYGVLIVTGLVFALTAVCYGVMAFREAQPAAAGQVQVGQKHLLMVWMSQHGEMALLSELGFLAVFTFAAIGTDEFWQRRNAER